MPTRARCFGDRNGAARGGAKLHSGAEEFRRAVSPADL